MLLSPGYDILSIDRGVEFMTGVISMVHPIERSLLVNPKRQQ
jgi:hypothetical protein